MMSNDQKIDETPPKMKKKRPKNGPRHQKWPKNPKNGLIFQAFSKKF